MIEIEVVMIDSGVVRATGAMSRSVRHYVVPGNEITLCGSLATRRPVIGDRYAPMCRKCDRYADSLRGR